jgi:hypothetical protein
MRSSVESGVKHQTKGINDDFGKIMDRAIYIKKNKD